MINKSDSPLKLIYDREDVKEVDSYNKLNYITHIEKTKIDEYFQGGLVENNPSNVKIYRELSLDFFKGKCTNIAKNLLGKLLINKTSEGITGGIIVETEAYIGKNDPACHLSNGFTKRNTPFYNGKGTIYVFKIYRYSNLNIISEYNSYPECILIRAIEPTHGLELMKKRRKTDELMKLTNGPGKLTEALGITKENYNNKKLYNSMISFYNTNLKNFDTITTTRIGISQARDWPLRYYIKDNPFVSKKSKKKNVFVSFVEDHYYEKYYMLKISTLTEIVKER